MSQSTQTQDDEFAEYRSTTGTEVKTADVSGESHALKQVIGTNDENKERIYDSTVAGQRFVDFYDDSAAAIREALSNAETACIRRARQEIKDAGYTVPASVTGAIEKARDMVGYEPLIEITYNQQTDETRLIIEDNGIGISVEEYQVLQRVGYSTSHNDGTVGGQFGLGFLSMFQLTSVDGAFRMYTRSRLTNEAYSTIEYVANFEYLDGEPQGYGTRFEFPEFSESAKEINIASKVEEFADGMRVPVLYRQFDNSGEETSKSDDFLPTNMEDDYADDSLVISYENEFFKAVMSPSTADGRRSGNLLTYNVTMPIRRNTDTFGSNPKFKAPWSWDFRGKREDGPIVKCDESPEIVGYVPIEDTKYEKLSDDQRDSHVRMSEVPDSAIVMPEPASSRDSYMSGYDDFWTHVSERLVDNWENTAASLFDSINSWSEFKDFSLADKKNVYRAFSEFGPGYKNNDPENIQKTLVENLDITVPKDICEKIDQSRSKQMVVPRGSPKARLKTPAKENKKRIWEILDEAPDGVYMAKTPSQKKAEIAWGLGDTHVLRVESYTELSEMWDFKKLKSLPSKNLSEKLPSLDADVAEKWENTTTSNSSRNSGSSGPRRTGRDPTTKKISVRVGKRSSRYISDVRVSRIESRFSNGEEIHAGRYSVSRLIIYDQTEMSGTTPSTSAAHKSSGVAVAAVPKYVYKYLKDVDNVYTSEIEAYADLKQAEIDEYDDAEYVVFVSSEIHYIINTDQKVRDIIDAHTNYMIPETASLTVRHVSDAKKINHCDKQDFDATIVSLNGNYRSKSFSDKKLSVDMVDIILENEIPDADYDSPYFKQIFGRKRYCSANDNSFQRGIEIVKEMGGSFPDQ